MITDMCQKKACCWKEIPGLFNIEKVKPILEEKLVRVTQLYESMRANILFQSRNKNKKYKKKQLMRTQKVERRNG